MTEQQVKDKVRAVLALMKPEWRWAAMDEGGEWFAYTEKPISHFYTFACSESSDYSEISAFNIPNHPGDWRESLVER